jgi:5-methylcytosine-specific restriction protein A
MDGVKTYLMLWNPDNYPKLFRDYDDWVAGSLPKDSWSSGGSKSIEAGSRVFLMRVHREPKGLIALGHTVSGWYRKPHYLDPAKLENVNDVVWDAFAHPDHPPLLLEDLVRIREPPQRWMPRASGRLVPDEIADELCGAWIEAAARAHVTQRLHVLDPNEVSPGRFREGAVKRVTVNAYERNERARQACIARHGTACAVCGLEFGQRYGTIGQGFIHVHHLREMSEIGQEYDVDPIEDLRPVCPNCHAMLHRTLPCLRIEELKALLRDAGVAQQ